MSDSGRMDALDGNYYYAKQGMGSLAMDLAKDLQVEQDVWVSPSSGARYQKSGRWRLFSSGQSLGEFDYLVIAHNGKCADRLMAPTPAQAVHRLLRVNFNDRVSPTASRMTLNSIYSLSLALPKGSALAKALPMRFTCGMIAASPTQRDLSFLTSQTNKFDPTADHEEEIWTILSSSSLAKAFKAPQEFLPLEIVDQVSKRLYASLESLLQLEAGAISNHVLDARLQLWGAATPLNVWHNQHGFVYDADYHVGVCGDWLVEPSIAGAWTSGYRLAEHLKIASKKTVGLEGRFQRSVSAFKAGIGALQG